MEWLYDWIWNLVIYFILVTAVSSVLPGETYRKYIRLFTGVVLILVMVQPLLNLLSLDERIEEIFQFNSFEQEREELRANMEGMAEIGQDYVMENYRKLLERQILALAKEEKVELSNIELILEEDEESSDYGRILYLSAGASEAAEGFAAKLSAEFGVPDENIRLSSWP